MALEVVMSSQMSPRKLVLAEKLPAGIFLSCSAVLCPRVLQDKMPDIGGQLSTWQSKLL